MIAAPSLSFATAVLALLALPVSARLEPRRFVSAHEHLLSARNAASGWTVDFVPTDHFGSTSPYHAGYSNPAPSYDGQIPQGCTVNQVHYHGRHGSRNPTNGTFHGLQRFAMDFATHQKALSAHDEFAFLKHWQFSFDANSVEQLSERGRAELYGIGQSLARAYPDLAARAKKTTNATAWTFNTNSQPRTVDSAYRFAEGFLGAPRGQGAASVPPAVAKHINWNVLPETSAPGPGSLFGYTSCSAFDTNYASAAQGAWQANFAPAIAARWNGRVQGYTFNASTVSTAQTLCTYETAVSSPGKVSPWCGLFTPAEQLAFEWYQDINYLTYHYTNPNSQLLGGPYVQLVAENLRKGASASQPIFTAFSHDNSLVPLLAAMDIYTSDGFNSLADVPTAGDPWRRAFRAGNVVRFGGNYIIESFTCPSVDASKQFVRFQVDQAFYPLENCGAGPTGAVDGMCELEAWLSSSPRISQAAKQGVQDAANLCNGGTPNPENVDTTFY